MGILRVFALPAAIAATTICFSSSSPFAFPTKLPRSVPSALATRCLRFAALNMDSSAVEFKTNFIQKDMGFPELLIEFMVDMKCDACVSAVKNNLLKLDGIKNVDVDLSNQVVRILGSVPVKSMEEALAQTGRSARLIGQGNPNDFIISASVAEFKGPVIYGVVRLAQVSMELAKIDASFSGLSPGKHAWTINEFGDLTEGAASTGKVFNPPYNISEMPLGDLGTLEGLDTGICHFSGFKEGIRVSDLIGRSIVVYATEDKSVPGIGAAVIARSAGVGENYKKLCTCDGVTIWESS